MAEILGTASAVAGLASLSIQLVETAMKLRGLYKAYKDVPQTVERLTSAIEAFGILLGKIEKDQNDQNDAGDEDLLGLCTLLCRQNMERILAVVSKLEMALAKSKRRGKLKGLMEEKEISQLCGDLEAAKTTLAIAHRFHADLQRRRAEDQQRQLQQATHLLLQQQSAKLDALIIRQEAYVPLQGQSISSNEVTGPGYVTELEVSSEGQTEKSTVKYKSRYSQARRKGYGRTSSYYFRVQPWFLSKVWHISMNVASAGWDLRVRTRNIIPWGAPIIDLCRLGDLAGVQRMFDEGSASPYDEISEGYEFESLLEVAISSAHIPLCRYLLKFVEVPDDINDSLYSLGMKKCLEIYQVLIQEHDMDTSFILANENNPEPVLPILWSSCLEIEVLEVILRSIPVAYESLPLQTRFRYANRLYRAWDGIYTRALGAYTSLDDLLSFRGTHGGTVLHELATFDKLEAGSQLLRDLIVAGADPSAQDDGGMTPLMVRISQEPVERMTISNWAMSLYMSGLDLVACGLREAELWSANTPIKTDIRLTDTYWPRPTFYHEAQATKLVFAPEPRDWGVELYLQKTIPIYSPRRSNAPGAWPAEENLLLPWQPREEDFIGLPGALHGSHAWEKSTLTLRSSATIFLSESSELHDWTYAAEHIDLIDRAQDDSGATYLGLQDTPTCRDTKARSRSQPADVRSSLESIEMRPIWFTHTFAFSGYHRCRIDSRWRFGQKSDWGSDQILTDQRNCMAGRCKPYRVREDIHRDICDEAEIRRGRQCST